ncbi:hypothetical protein AQUCO_01700709v1 [Aquilegia coerulea]|uniref:RING-type E3 ubiquitin transferase n=1 Tax=Aquilegia coerulea TaxID=218851 RepID=A0A2G5DP99_AQUCA|nr:hypothetical protein AQUCO_01700709v1 [Aquilegia coerulea]
MDSVRRSLTQYGSQALPSMRNQQQIVYRTPSPPSDTSSPILVIAILGITLTAFVLLGYYVLVIKCWLNCHRVGFLRQFFTTQTRRFEDPLMAYEPATENRGVDESVIQALPVFQFRKGEGIGDAERRSYFECAVCLNEFQDEEKLRVLPSCSHVFHIDCIDIWLQSNANCPLCRSSISSRTRVLPIQIIAPSSSPQDQTPVTETTISGDEDFVVIEVRGSASADQTTHSHRRQDTAKSGELLSKSVNPSPRKFEQRLITKKQRKFHHGASLGDECIDIRGKDDQFSVQSVRRSFSMDSSTDRQLFLAVQDIIQQNRPLNEVSTSAGCSSRVRRPFFSFGHGRG